MDYRDPAIRAKAHAAASLLGEPAASELRAALDALGAADAEAKQASALRAALLEVYRVLSGEEPADDALAALAEYTVDEARHARRLLDEARAEVAALTESYAGYSAKAETRIAELEAEVAETRLRLAIWSGEGVPEGWEPDADGEPYLWLAASDGTVRVESDGTWRDLDYTRRHDAPGPRPILEALRAAEAWLAGVAP